MSKQESAKEKCMYIYFGTTRFGSFFQKIMGWSNGATVLGKLLVPGRPTNLDDGRARACCACSRCGWGLFGHFSQVFLFSFLFPRDVDLNTVLLDR